MIVAALSALLAFFALSTIFTFVLGRLREDDEASPPLVTLLTVAVSASSVLVVLFAPAAILFALLLVAEYVAPDAVYHGDPWHLLALALTVALVLFVYELLFEGFLTGLLKHLGLPATLVKVVEGLLTAVLLVVGSEQVVRSVEVSAGAALAAGAANASVSYFLERLYDRSVSRG